MKRRVKMASMSSAAFARGNSFCLAYKRGMMRPGFIKE